MMTQGNKSFSSHFFGLGLGLKFNQRIGEYKSMTKFPKNGGIGLFV